MTQHHSRASILSTMLYIALMFFILGFVTWLNGSLIPFLKIVCDLSDFQALWVTFAFYIAYTVMALPSAAILSRIGYKNGMSVSLAVMALAALLFIPAAQTRQYSLFLLALFTLASAMTLMQTAINPYIVCIGARESAAMRISIMGLFNKGAGIVVPLVFTSLILSNLPPTSASTLAAMSETSRLTLQEDLAARLVTPYIVMALALLAFMLIVHFSSLPDLKIEEETQATSAKWGVLAFPQVVLGALTLFAYVGVEVIAGDTIGLYGHHLGLPHYAALTSYTMSFMVLGYIVGAVCIPRYLSQKNALMMSAIAGLVFTIGILVSSPQDQNIAQTLFAWTSIPRLPNSVLFVAMLGFANALVWPTVWPLALQGLGAYTAAGSALLIMGIAGGAILPMIYGHLSDQGGAQSAYWMMLPCYLMIFFYALKGHRITRW